MASDKTIKLLISMGLDKSEAAKVRKGIKSVDDALNDIAKSSGKTSKKVKQDFEAMQRAAGGLNTQMGSLVKSIAAAGAAYAAANWAKDFVVDSYNAAASAERLGTATDTLGKRFGVSGEQIVASIKKASNGTISEIDAMKAANQAMLLNVVQSEEQFGQLAEMAVVLGRAMGQDATKSIEDITVGIGRQSRLILDNLGIIVDAETAYQNYADKIGKAKDELTDQEKQIAFTNEVMRQGQAAVSELGGVADDTAAKTERLTSNWSDFQVAFGQLLGDAGALDALNSVIEDLIAGAEAWSEVFTQADRIVTANRQVQASDENAGINRNLQKASIYAAAPILAVPGELTGATDYLLDLAQGSVAAAAGSKDMADAYQSLLPEIEAVTTATQDVVTTTEEATISADDYAKALDKISEANSRLETDTRRKQLDAERDNLRDIAEMEEDFLRDRLDMQMDFARKMSDAAEKLAQDRVDIARQSLQEIADIERQYTYDLSDLGTDARRSLIKVDSDLANERLSIERDYQQRLFEIRREFEQSAEEAVRNNDAIAFLRAQRQRDNNITDAQIDRDNKIAEAEITAQQEREQQQAKYQQELDDLKIKLERELSAQREATARKLQEAEIDFTRRRQAIAVGYAQEIADQATAEARKRADLQTAYQQKLADLRIYYNQRLVDTRNALQAEYQLIAQYTAQMRQARSGGVSSAGGANYSGYTAAMGAAYTAAFAGRRAAGGYAGRGLYNLGEAGTEFVMNAAVTRQMEQALGGRITSGGLAAMANNSMSNTFNFSERDDAKMIMGQVSQIIDSKMMRLERGY
jgi:hypothetical protein